MAQPPDSNSNSPLSDRIVSAPDHRSRQGVWRAVNRNPRAILCGLAALYLAIACAQAGTKLLWGDELITLAIARQGSLAAIWHALALGADPNPPLMHWLVMVSTAAFGQSALAIRLPAIGCGLLAVGALWTILRRWVSPGYAAVGILAFMATRGFDYVYDARSYTPLMGFGMASLACWLCSIDRIGWPRVLALTGMAAALSLGLCSNYYGVLAFFPIAVGEAVRSLRARRLFAGAWVAMACASLPLLAFLPLIRHNIAEFSPHAWNRPRAGMIVDSYLELVEGVFWPVLALALLAAWKWSRKTSSSEPPPDRNRVQPQEFAGLLTLLLYPFLGLAIAAGGAGMISPRCVVPVCCGFGIAAALLAHRLFGGNARAGAIVLSLALLWVVARESVCAIILHQQRTAFFALRDEIAARPPSEPIVIGDSLVVLPMAHYSSENVRALIFFPIDFDAIHAQEDDDSGEQNLWAGRGMFPVQILPYGVSLFRARDLTVVAAPHGWLASSLMRDGLSLDEDPGQDDGLWRHLGGVFTPLAHERTRILRAKAGEYWP